MHAAARRVAGRARSDEREVENPEVEGASAGDGGAPAHEAGAEYPDNVSLTGVFRSLTQPRTNKPIPKSPMSRDAQCAARNLDFDVGLCVGQTGLMGVH